MHLLATRPVSVASVPSCGVQLALDGHNGQWRAYCNACFRASMWMPQIRCLSCQACHFGYKVPWHTPIHIPTWPSLCRLQLDKSLKKQVAVEQQLQEFLDLCTSLQGQVKSLTDSKAVAELQLREVQQQLEGQAAAMAEVQAGKEAAEASCLQAEQVHEQLQQELASLR